MQAVSVVRTDRWHPQSSVTQQWRENSRQVIMSSEKDPASELRSVEYFQILAHMTRDSGGSASRATGEINIWDFSYYSQYILCSKHCNSYTLVEHCLRLFI